MTDTAAPRVVMRFRGLCGATITVTERGQLPGSGTDETYTAECAGCLNTLADDFAGFPKPDRSYLKDARTWAARHAANCRALPQPTGETEIAEAREQTPGDDPLVVWEIRGPGHYGERREYYTTRGAAELRAETACAASHPGTRPEWSTDSGGNSWSLWLAHPGGEQEYSSWNLAMVHVRTEPAVDEEITVPF